MIPILFLNTSHYLPLYVLRGLPVKKYTVYCMGPAEIEVRFSKYCRGYIECEKNEFSKGGVQLADKINAVCKELGIECIIPLDVCTQTSITKIRSHITTPLFPLATEQTINMLDHKWEIARFAKRFSIPHPPTEYMFSMQELAQTKFPIPFFIKPTSLSSGLGITRIGSVQDLVEYTKTVGDHKIFPLIIQKEIVGTDIDVSVLAVDGKVLAWTVQLWHELGLLEYIDDAQAVEIAQKIVKHSNYSGLLHIDMRRDVSTNSLVTFECNPRAWGSINASAYAGVDFIGLGIAAALGRPIEFTHARHVSYEATWHLLKKLCRNPLAILSISKTSWLDFYRVISDIRPYAVILFRVIFNKGTNKH